ncbi:protein kinase domain-containing protein [Rhodococcus erythropolis]|uniref:protein kinase domain-containing protein n=1 Tax=Rhodococcus erythropolis TaxID=1833 RepID=UPI0036712D56
MSENDDQSTQRYAFPANVEELILSGFEDVVEIGRGGFGTVYRCLQTELNRTAAVKVLTAELNEENRARFLREQRAMGTLCGHPNIVNVLQIGTTVSDRPYIVMQYHSKGSLDARIRLAGPLSLEQALRFGVEISGALETGHRRGILHRDVKPANILLTDYGDTALADFGIARIPHSFETTNGEITASPAFAAPEVLTGDPPTPSTDVYGLGATLFSALTGRAPFERRSGEQVVAQFVRMTTQLATDLREDGIPDDVSRAIEHAMSPNPQDRPSAAEFGDELRAIQRHRGLHIDEMALHVAAIHGEASERSDPTESPRSRSEMIEPAKASTRSPKARGGNLPVMLTSFVGRRKEVTDARRLLSSFRVVTLTGIGGVGKTRLALRVAYNLRRSFRDGVWLVELGELTDGSALEHTTLAALSVQDQTIKPLRDVLMQYLAARETLLVLDNCEQVVDAVADFAYTALSFCPNLRILATSREALAIDGEALLRVPPLTSPDPHRALSLKTLPRYDAMTLFADRATAAVPTFELTADNISVVAQICHRIDGLPLPIELAAARLRAMSADQILQRLNDRYALLNRGSRGAPTRQQTLQLCIDWSYELCTTLEKKLWARLSVFAGSFELDAVEQVCNQGLQQQEILDAVTSLVDKSILIRDESGVVVRFRLLETLRDYGQAKLKQSHDSPGMRRHHRDWYERLVHEAEADWGSARQQEWIARLDREWPNLREALDFCGSDSPAIGLRIVAGLHLFWITRGPYSEGRRWLERFLNEPGAPTTDRVKALYSASVLAEFQCEFSAGAEYVDEARALAAKMSDPVAVSFADYASGLLALFTGDITRAYSDLERSLKIVDDRYEHPLHVNALNMFGLVNELRGDAQRAIECYERVLDITDGSGEQVFRSYALWGMGVALWRQGDADRAEQSLRQSLLLAREMQNLRTATTCLEILAWIAASGNRDVQRAAVLMGAADGLGRSVGSVAILFPNLRGYHDEATSLVRGALDSRSFDAAHSAGLSFDFEAALNYALGTHSNSPDRTAVPSAPRLTKRETQVAELVAEGLTNRAVAARLVISLRTAQGHVEHILTKLGFTSRAQIAAWVVEQARPRDAEGQA